MERKKQAHRVFLVVVDQSAELKLALRFAARRARATGGRVAMLYVTEPAEAEWLGVGDIMREERRAEAEQRLQELSTQVQNLSGEMPILYVREGNVREELLKLIDEEPSISILVLAADAGAGGPGPLVTALTGKFAGKLHIPLTIVPGSLTEEEVDAIT
ncbi:MAG TPA: universal stress protein [Alphaproteobacteria bacterium]|nr:universal stress protein [Alphaproteobacteria bacterium]